MTDSASDTAPLAAIRIGVFAAGQIGLEVVKHMVSRGDRPECLVVDSREAPAHVAQIVSASGLTPERILCSDRLNSTSGVDALGAMNLDLALLAWWPYLVKPHVLSIPRLGCLNFHPSLLPFNRGKHYNFWTLVEETPFGVTLHFADEGIDTGDIAFQRAIDKTWEDTGQSLYEKAQAEILRLFADHYEEIRSGSIPRRPQDRDAGTFRRATEMETASRIDLDRVYSGRALLNLLRARTFPPHPACYFEADGGRFEARVEIRRARTLE